jgi:hypothetical protein
MGSQESGVRSQKVEIKILNVQGKVVTILTPDSCLLNSGIIWDTSNLESGLYLCRLTGGKYTAERKMLLVK